MFDGANWLREGWTSKSGLRLGLGEAIRHPTTSLLGFERPRILSPYDRVTKPDQPLYGVLLLREVSTIQCKIIVHTKCVHVKVLSPSHPVCAPKPSGTLHDFTRAQVGSDHCFGCSACSHLGNDYPENQGVGQLGLHHGLGTCCCGSNCSTPISSCSKDVGPP